MTARPTPTPRALLAIRPAAEPAWRQLSAALDDMRDDGRRPPCAGTGDVWFLDQAEAAAACGWCPARTPCLAFAVANREPCGTWGGRDFATATDHDDDERTTAA